MQLIVVQNAGKLFGVLGSSRNKLNLEGHTGVLRAMIGKLFDVVKRRFNRETTVFPTACSNPVMPRHFWVTRNRSAPSRARAAAKAAPRRQRKARG